MPCYDKKLEASRPDFYNETLHTRDVDCVLTTQEVLDIIQQKQIDFVALPETPIPSLYDTYHTLSLLNKQTNNNDTHSLSGQNDMCRLGYRSSERK